MRPFAIALARTIVIPVRLSLFLVFLAGMPLTAPALGPEQQDWLALVKNLEKDPAGESSLDTVRQFLKKYPASDRLPAAQYALAETLFRRGQYREAIPVFENLARSPLLESAIYRASQCHFNLEEYAAARDQWERLLKLYPKTYLHPEIDLDRAQLMILYGQTEPARKALAGVVPAYPLYQENRRLAAGLAFLDLQAQHPDEAFQRLEHRTPSPVILAAKGACLIALAKYAEAAQLVDEPVPGPEGTLVKAGLLVKLMEPGQFELAGFAAGRLLARPDFDGSLRDEVQLLAAYADIRAGNFEEYDRLKAKLDGSGSSVAWDLLYMEGLAEFLHGQKDAAYQIWEKMLRQFENHPETPVRLYQVAALALADNDSNRARDYCERLLLRFPQSPASGWACLCLSQAYYKIGKDQEAMTAYREYVRRGSPKAPEIPVRSDSAACLRLAEPAIDRIQAQIQTQAAAYGTPGRISESSMVAAPWLNAIVKPPVLVIRPQKTSLPFASWSLTLSNESGKILFRESGGHPLPETIEWDGHSLEGRMIGAGEKFVYTILLRDSADKVLMTTSQASVLNSLAYEDQAGYHVQFSSRLLFSRGGSGFSDLGLAILHEACDLALQHWRGKLILKVRGQTQSDILRAWVIEQLDLPSQAVVCLPESGETVSLECLPAEGGGAK